MNLAPIAISVYTRIEHFKQCIEALQNNLLADQSELFIYSDAAVNMTDEEMVKEIRKYSYTITGFKNVYVIEREKNLGGTKNAYEALCEITSKYGKSIFLEDDIISAPGFLAFINQALEFYKNNERINSITGFCLPINIPKNYAKDYFVLPAFNGWGTGMWDKSLALSQEITFYDFKKIASSNKNFKQFHDASRFGVLPMVIFNKLNAGDARMTFYQTINNKYTIYPTVNLVKNIGNDGSGVHCGVNNVYSQIKLSEKTSFTFDNNIELNNDILKLVQKFRSVSLLSKMKSIVKFPLFHLHFLKALMKS